MVHIKNIKFSTTFLFDKKEASLELWKLPSQARRRRSATIEAGTPNGIWMVISPWKLGKMKPYFDEHTCQGGWKHHLVTQQPFDLLQYIIQ